MKQALELSRTRGRQELQRLFFRLRWLARLLPNERHVPLFWAAIAGLLGAAAALLFQLATHGLQWLLTGGHMEGRVETFRHLATWQRVAIPAIGGLGAGFVLWMSQRIVGRKSLDYMEAVALGDGVVRLGPGLLRSLASLFSIASGASIGREGPLVQLAAACASVTGRLRAMSPARLRLMVACGAAAGIAAAYNAPIAAALFVAEIILGSIAMDSLGPLLIASVVSALTTRFVTGDAPLYAFASFHLGSLWELPLFGLLGVLCALAAHVFQDALHAGRWLFNRLPRPAWFRLGLGGLVFGLVAVWWPQVAGNGQSVIREFLGENVPAGEVAVLLVLKMTVVAIVFGSGAVGGVFTPSLFTGAATGLLVGLGAAHVFPQLGIAAHGYALVGMGALLAAATQAPVMSMLMIFEMSLQYQIMPPLMIAVVAAHVTARSLGGEPLYAEALRTGPRSIFDKPLGVIRVADVMRARSSTVAPDAPFRAVAQQFLRAPSREMFVCDGDGRYQGTVLLDDVRNFLRDADLADVVPAHDIVRDDVPTVDRELGLPDALAVFSRCEREALPVVEAPTGRLVGTLLRSDVLMTVSELARRESVRTAGG